MHTAKNIRSAALGEIVFMCRPEIPQLARLTAGVRVLAVRDNHFESMASADPADYALVAAGEARVAIRAAARERMRL